MILRSTILAIATLLLLNCSGSKVGIYREGDLHSRTFLSHISSKKKPAGEFFIVKRNKQGQIISAKHYANKKHLLEKSRYTYSRSGDLKRHQSTVFFFKGPPQITREWVYSKGRLTTREESWFTRSRSLERRLTILYDSEQKPYLEQTWGIGLKIESSTEYYYDYNHRLDKSRRNFFNPDGGLRDYWLTLYNDENQITHEEHYLADNSLIAFYRYSYHPVLAYREREELLDEERDIFISRTFDEYGLILSEEERNREMNLLSKVSFEYNMKHKPVTMRHYDGEGKLLKTSKYKVARYLQTYRTPGI